MHRSQSKFLSIFILSTAAAFVILTNQASRAAIETGPVEPLASPISKLASTPGPHLIWQPLDFPVLPPPRIGFALTIDTGRQEALLFGGYNSAEGYLNDIWWTNGHQWTNFSGYSAPVGRFGASLVYDEERSETILYGGYYNSEFLGTTFTWVPYAWTQQFPHISPPPRVGASMAYDAARKETILFGGNYSVGKEYYLLNDTWAWDGADWQQLPPANSPPERDRAQMVYDRARQNIILFGGGSYAISLNDTWIWDGVDWIEQHPLHTPPRLVDFGMTYDESRQQVILWGGWISPLTPDGRETGTWAWDGQDWTQLETYREPPYELANSGRLVYLPTLKTTIMIGELHNHICSSEGDCTSSNETQVWALTSGYLSYFPAITSVKQ